MSLTSFNTWACPDLTGAYFDSDAQIVKHIVQKRCESTSWSDEEGSTTLLADNVERVLQSEGSMTAYARVHFTKEDLVIDIRMDWGNNSDLDLPVRWITSYRLDKKNNMVEKIIPYKKDGTMSGIEYVTFRRVD